MVHTNLGLIHFDIANIDPGYGTLANCLSNTVGNSCTTPGSPFTLTQVTPQTVAFTFSVEGVFYTGSSLGGTTPGVALLKGQQVPGTITEVLNVLQTTGNFSNTYSGGFSEAGTPSTTPEPGTLAMLLGGIGLMAIGEIRPAPLADVLHAGANVADGHNR
jgi:hypothetical protein